MFNIKHRRDSANAFELVSKNAQPISSYKDFVSKNLFTGSEVLRLENLLSTLDSLAKQACSDNIAAFESIISSLPCDEFMLVSTENRETSQCIVLIHPWYIFVSVEEEIIQLRPFFLGAIDRVLKNAEPSYLKSIERKLSKFFENKISLPKLRYPIFACPDMSEEILKGLIDMHVNNNENSDNRLEDKDEKIIDTLTGQVQNVKNDIENAETQAKEIAVEIENLRSEISIKRVEAEQRRQLNASCDCESLGEMITGKREKIEKLQQEIALAKETSDTLQANIPQVVNRLKEVRDEIKCLAHARQTQQASLEHAQRDFDQANNKIHWLRQQIDALCSEERPEVLEKSPESVFTSPRRSTKQASASPARPSPMKGANLLTSSITSPAINKIGDMLRQEITQGQWKPPPPPPRVGQQASQAKTPSPMKGANLLTSSITSLAINQVGDMLRREITQGQWKPPPPPPRVGQQASQAKTLSPMKGANLLTSSITSPAINKIGDVLRREITQGQLKPPPPPSPKRRENQSPSKGYSEHEAASHKARLPDFLHDLQQGKESLKPVGQANRPKFSDTHEDHALYLAQRLSNYRKDQRLESDSDSDSSTKWSP